jgi:hypothetical protein
MYTSEIGLLAAFHSSPKQGKPIGTVCSQTIFESYDTETKEISDVAEAAT